MRIGELASLGGVSTAAIRFYERVGVIGAASRTHGGYRSYDLRALAELRFVQAAQAIGLTLGEIAEIVAFRDTGQAPCTELVALMERHLCDVERRLEELARVRADLTTLLAAARRSEGEDCTAEAVYRMVTPPTA